MYKLTKLSSLLLLVTCLNVGMTASATGSVKDHDWHDRIHDHYEQSKHSAWYKYFHYLKRKWQKRKHIKAELLEPRSLPDALAKNSGKVDVTFRVQLVAEDIRNPKYVFLREKRRKNCHYHDCYKSSYHKGRAHKLNDNGENGDAVAGDNIYSATVTVNTDAHRYGHHAKQCRVYDAFTYVGKRKKKIKSPGYNLCTSSFPIVIDESDTSPENLVKISEDTSPAVADELLVRFSSQVSDRQIRFIVKNLGGEVVGSILQRNLYQVRFPQALTEAELKAAIQNFNNHPLVASAYLNRVGSFVAVPNDPEFPGQHGLQHIRADDAWDLGATGNGINVAILDSGIQTHADLPIMGVDAINHGTTVAGVIAAITDNATGIAGVAYDSTLESFVVSADASVTMAEMVAGFQAVAAAGTADVVTAAFNISLAPPPVDIGGFDDQFDLCAAINDVVVNVATPQAIVITGAGNDNSDTWHYPSKCNDNSAAAHAELTRKDLLIPVLNSQSCTSGCVLDDIYSTSNYGAWVDVAAPGFDIRSTNNAGGYDSFTGTSLSVAHVAGTAAQLLSCGESLDQIESRLQSSATVNVSYPGGTVPRVDAYDAASASAIASNTAPTAINVSGSTSIDENIDTSAGLTIGSLTTVDADDCDQFSYNIQGGADAADFSIGGADMDELVFSDGVLDFETQASYSVVVRVTDIGGATFDETFTININDLPEMPPAIPNPIIDWVLPVPFENYTDAFGDPYTRYRFEVTNRAAYPAELFDPAPALPPCGLNTNSARTWVEIYNGVTDAYIYGFCALGSPDGLGSIWFAIPQGSTPPPSIYITLTDRQTSTVYTSNVLAVP